jgi:hypothetical protein
MLIDLNKIKNNLITNLTKGSFGGWITQAKNINLECYMIFRRLDGREWNMIRNDKCLIYAMRQYGVDKNKLDDMRYIMKCNSFSLSKIPKEYDISIEVSNEKDMKISYFWVIMEEIIKLLLNKNHYILQDKIFEPYNGNKPRSLLKILGKIITKKWFECILIHDIIQIHNIFGWSLLKISLFFKVFYLN